jgi:ferredoxin
MTKGETPLVVKGTGKILSMDLMAELFSVIARSMGKKLTSFHDECIDCGRCIRECPQQNIVKRSGGGVVFQGKCMLCTRCLHGCPVHAIGYGGIKYEQYPGPEKLIGQR